MGKSLHKHFNFKDSSENILLLRKEKLGYMKTVKQAYENKEHYCS